MENSEFFKLHKIELNQLLTMFIHIFVSNSLSVFDITILSGNLGQLIMQLLILTFLNRIMLKLIFSNSTIFLLSNSYTFTILLLLCMMDL